MSIKLGYIVIENYNSYLGKHKISFKEKQGNLVIIMGVNEIDGSSNGAGKSSIVDALVMACFGKSLNRELNLEDFICNKSDDPMRLEFGFEDSADGVVAHNYVIERIRGKAANSAKCNLYEDGLLISDNWTNTETQNQIDKILGIDYNMFTNTNVLNPELFRFVKGNNTQKLDILERTLNLNIIAKIYKTLNDRTIEDQEVHSKVDTELYALNTSYTNLKKQSENVNDHIQESINTIVSNNEKLQEQINELELSHQKALEEKETVLQPIVDKITSRLTTLKEEKIRLEQSIAESKKILKYYEDNEKCYACKQDLPDRESIIITEKNNLKCFSSEKETTIAQEKELNAKPELKTFADLVENISNIGTKIREKKYNIEQNNKNIEKFQKITTTSDAGMVEKVKETIELTTKEWNTTKKLFETTGFWKDLLMPKSQTRMALAGDLLKILNTYIQKYVKNFYSKDFRFNFIVKDNNIEELIVKNGKKMKYSQLSSGERQKVDIVIVISLLDIAMSYFKNNKLKFLIIDEALDHLDPVWGRYVVEFIKQYAISMNMMCLLISHHGIIDEMNYIFDNKIVVSKGIDDSSHIKN